MFYALVSDELARHGSLNKKAAFHSGAAALCLLLSEVDDGLWEETGSQQIEFWQAVSRGYAPFGFWNELRK